MYVLLQIFSLTFTWWSVCNPWEWDWCLCDISENDFRDVLLKLQHEVMHYLVYTGLLREHSVLFFVDVNVLIFINTLVCTYMFQCWRVWMSRILAVILFLYISEVCKTEHSMKRPRLSICPLLVCEISYECLAPKVVEKIPSSFWCNCNIYLT
jgi:hypothetical protein